MYMKITLGSFYLIYCKTIYAFMHGFLCSSQEFIYLFAYKYLATVGPPLDRNSVLVRFVSATLIVSRHAFLCCTLLVQLLNKQYFFVRHMFLCRVLMLQDFFHFCSFNLMLLGEKIKAVLQRHMCADVTGKCLAQRSSVVRMPV